jgi:hypothetical protein
MRSRPIWVESVGVTITAFLAGTAVTMVWNLAVEGRIDVNWALMIALAVGIGVSNTWTSVACGRRAESR